MKIYIIAAVDNNSGIGKDGTIPWKCPEDLKYFNKKTSRRNNAIVMGRKTYESIGKPLNNRLNIVLSKSTFPNILSMTKLSDVIKYCESNDIDELFICGGRNVYMEALIYHKINKCYFSIIPGDFACDTFFPFEYLTNITSKYKYFGNTDELQYLTLLDNTLNSSERKTRNGLVRSLFNYELSFNLKTFPLLTTKRTFFRGIVEELLFFLRGDTDAKLLQDKNVKIWDKNTSREFLDNVGLEHYVEGEMGPMYGYNWRKFGAKYKSNEKGYDQLKYIINLLKNDKYNRRILMTTLDPSTVDQCVLPPCHGICTQFYCREENGETYLDVKMVQRSADIFLGVPFNIGSYSLLVYILCHVLNYKPGKLIMSLNDVHLYNEHENAAIEQLKRIPYNFPTLKINKQCDSESIDDMLEYIETLEFNDFELTNYICHAAIKTEMIA